MKVAALALVLLATCVLTVQSNRDLLQASAPAPGPCTSIPDAAQAAGLTTLIQAVTLAGLASTLGNTSAAFTVFAPTNDAFASTLKRLEVPNLSLDSLQQMGLLVPTLENHVLEEALTTDQLSQAKTETPLGGQALTFSGTKVTAKSGNSANIITPNVQACQSIVHVIDNVLVPDVTKAGSGGS